MTDGNHQSPLEHYLGLERELLALRAAAWLRGEPAIADEVEEEFFDRLESAAARLSTADRATLRAIVISRATSVVSDGDQVDVAAPGRFGLAVRKVASVA